MTFTLRSVFKITFILFLTALSVSSARAESQIPRSTEQIKLSFSPVVKKAAPSVVNIYTSRIVQGRRHPFANDPFFGPFFRDFGMGSGISRRIENSLGSGFIARPNGLIVTNAHVIENADEISVILQDGREFDAEISLVDKGSDIALIQIVAPNRRDMNLPYLSFHPSDALEVGDLVLAIGNPFGVGQSVTSGIISALARSTTDINDFNFFIQTDAAINPGNSGGPLVNLHGNVVGLNTAIYSRDGGSSGIGFAIPSEMVEAVLHAHDAGQRGENGLLRPWSGFTGQDITADIASSLGLDRPSGVIVKSVQSDSPASKAGLRQGDLITAINGRKIVNNAELNFRLATLKPDTNIRLDIMRQDRAEYVNFKLITPPEIPARELKRLSGQHPLNGVEIVNISPAVAHEIGLPDMSTKGVIITEVARGSVASRLGFGRGDIIREINGRGFETTKELAQFLTQTSARGWSLKIERNGRIRSVYFR